MSVGHHFRRYADFRIFLGLFFFWSLCGQGNPEEAASLNNENSNATQIQASTKPQGTGGDNDINEARRKAVKRVRRRIWDFSGCVVAWLRGLTLTMSVRARMTRHINIRSKVTKSTLGVMMSSSQYRARTRVIGAEWPLLWWTAWTRTS
jgi:hypothetical protein